jgi:hypothetical protein|tara:strand:- start:197 stop:715 length:519 start_codon:yes stop_codon:yes gene_type:complete
MKDVLILLIPLAGMLLITYLLLQHFFNKQLKESEKELINQKAKSYLPLKIQAYERAILFLERIDPNNLIIRIHKPTMNASKLHLEILKQIREEYNHNMSQQIYISPKSWAELIKGKEETIQIANTAFGQLKNDANAIELSTKIFEIIAKLPHNPAAQARKLIIREFQKGVLK